ncbi:MAG TPA: c-type cytochrome [Gemmatimonadaceae bacterium]|nr:c-type cytochrome [Gemmatimonadaceae bacterium]
MTHSSLQKPLAILLAAAAFAACHKTAPMAGPTPEGAPSASVAARAANAMPAGVTAATIAMGDSIFHARTCARCHGPEAKGAQGGPDLTTSTHLHVNGSYDDFVRIITDGVPRDSIKVATHRFPMPARGGPRPAPLTDDQVHAVAAYVYSLSHK